MFARALPVLVASVLAVGCSDRSEPPAAPAPASAAATAAEGPAESEEARKEKAKKDEDKPSRPRTGGGPPQAQALPESVAAPGPATPPIIGDVGARPLAAISSAAEGKVGRSELESVVAANLERFRPCATEDATVELEVTVSAGGSVTAVKALRSRPDTAKLRDCVVDAFRGIAFARGAGSETSTVTFELALTRQGF